MEVRVATQTVFRPIISELNVVASAYEQRPAQQLH